MDKEVGSWHEIGGMDKMLGKKWDISDSGHNKTPEFVSLFVYFLFNWYLLDIGCVEMVPTLKNT